MKRSVLLTSVVFTVWGCGQFPDPNDMSRIAPEDRAGAAYRWVQSTVSTLQYKVEKQEITDEERMKLIREESEELLRQVDVKRTPPADFWMLADMYRTTRRWKEAEPLFEKAVKVAASEDRKVNDTLRLAQCQAQNGKVKEAVETARKVFDVADDQCAPILPATLYEIVPPAEGKGQDAALGRTLARRNPMSYADQSRYQNR